jgi:hypothetical protein
MDRHLCALSSQVAKKKKDKFSVNVIHFVRVDTGAKENDEARFRQFTSLLGGDYRTLAGLEAIQSSASQD